MITDKIIYWLASLIDDGDDVPAWRLPGWVDEASGYAGTVFAYADSLGAWVNFGLVSVVAASVLSSVLVGFGIKIARLGVGFVSGRTA